MADIRFEDRGYHTRVFSITSKSLGKRQICIGKPYDENSRDRYNVYPVVDGAVGGRIGYYEVESGTKVQDDAGDFDVARFNEPTWTTGKPKQIDEEIEKEKEAPPPPRSNFEIVDTVTDGNCFYDTVTRAIAGKPYKKDTTAIMAMRKQLGEFITNDKNLFDLTLHYSALASPEKIQMKADAYYGKYYKHLKNKTMNLGEIEEAMEEEREKDNIDPSKLNIDDFTKFGPDDESPNQSDSEHALATELKDYFDGNEKMEDSEEIKTTFLKNINKSGVWASEFVISKYEVMENIMLVFLDHDSTKEIEDLNVNLWSLPGVMIEPNTDTRYILSDYENARHFKLIAHTNPALSLFTQQTLPEVMNKKLMRLKKSRTPTPDQESDMRDESPEPVRNTVSKTSESVRKSSTEPESKTETVRKSTEPETVRKSSTEPESKTETVQKSTEPETVRKSTEPETVRKSTEPETVRKSTEPETVRKSTEPETVRKSTEPETVRKSTEPEPVQNTSVKTGPPYTEKDFVRLSTLSLSELNELLNDPYFQVKNILKSNKTKKSIIDCLLERAGPDSECKTRKNPKNPKGGDKFTRRK
jgi:hypothetical protein